MKAMFYVLSMIACGFIALTTGCASGGFKLTRQYAGWVNSQNVFIRIIVYLLTGVVFAVTMLIDFVVFNTMDFWNGRVSQGTYDFQKDDKTYQVRHEIIPGTDLKKSTIVVRDQNQKQLQEVILEQTAQNEIILMVDGKLKSKVTDIQSIPMMSLFDSAGNVSEKKALIGEINPMEAAYLAQM